MAGKEYTIVVLSSSPPIPDAFSSPRFAAPSRRVAMPPSSPFTLSPPLSPRKSGPGVLTSGSRAAPIPERASRGFATVSSLVRSDHFAPQMNEDTAGTQTELHESTEAVVAAVKKPVKRAAKKATATDGENPKPKPKPKPRSRGVRADKESEHAKTTLDTELRLPRTTKSPFFENVEAHAATTDEPTEAAADAPKLTKSGKPRKPRAKRVIPQSDVTEPKPKKTRVTKAKTAAGAVKAARETAEAVPAHVAVDKDVNITEKRSASADGGQSEGATIWDVPQSPQSGLDTSKARRPDPLAEGLDLDEAVSRRRDWTPPRDTVAHSPMTNSTGKENRPSSHDTTAGNFTHLISNFTYESPTSKVARNTTMPTSGLAKRRRAEPVELSDAQAALSPEKGKAPKKKPRTITDLVTGQYESKDPNVGLQAITSDFFAPHTSTTKVPLNDVNASNVEVLPTKPSRKRTKSKDASESTTTKAKPRARKASTKAAAKPKPVAEKLLSPTSAATRLNRQEVLFGTSSQLALEESPSTVRQIQRAIAESEQDRSSYSNLVQDAPPRWPKLQRTKGKRGLWRESTRDGDGGLLVDTRSVYIPAPDRTQDLPLLMDLASEECGDESGFVDIDDIAPARPDDILSSGFVDIDDITPAESVDVSSNLPSLVDVAREEPGSPVGFVDIDDIAPTVHIDISSDLPTPPGSQSPKQVPGLALAGSVADDVFHDIDDFGSGLPPSNQNAESQNSFVDIDDFHPPPVKASIQVHASTSRPPAATGSPAKRRGRPPKEKSAIPIVSTSAPPSARKSAPPRRMPQGSPSTPPKGSSRFVDIEEILDSEDETLEAFSPTPPRVRRLQDSPPLPLAFDREPSAVVTGKADEPITPVVRIQSSHLEWANIKPSICTAITAHVRTIPPTSDPKKPSWHEKILMYDPIILEDFTAYLNSNTKLRTYRRATQKQIKTYNSDLKSRGNAILGADRDDQVLAIEKDLEVHMVRDWCQEMSICCIHAKESRGRGSARKGFY
ncbi:hypothetical protein C7974DRAFT_388040 [Boeremia exigua]|uniref:uncharacterized protein n=1 Tax=Boeremia exigua TaxID=749465 RepID=UPI001E8E754C|nr:uncharacterized protein C7974DRAFT_388040 [Boeremia exigua]KAH6639217.1 hypothetical protein C7974DRAFT_388040 [Boeremia exigua]